MGFKAAAGGLVFLLSVSVIQSQSDWAVTYTSTNICALKGSSVELRCTYRYPSTIYYRNAVVEKTFWFTKVREGDPVDLSTDPEYAGRVKNRCDMNSCTLTITDLRESDSAEYKFRLITNQRGGIYTGSPGVTLSVTALQVKKTTYYSSTELSCVYSGCRLPGNPSYIWYKNGQKIERTTSYYPGHVYPGDSYVCAVRGHEDFHSPPLCVGGPSCNTVAYSHRSICAPKGSSVDISSTYSSSGSITSKLWFSPERSGQWVHQSQPEDLSKDPQYAGRVQVLEPEGGRSTVRISELTERDSAQYHFTFTAGSFEWRSSLPGTTLTVTALQVQVTTARDSMFYIEAELKCLSSCSPAARLSFVWFKNGQKIMTEETSTYKDNFYRGDNVSCAFKGREDYRSPPVYPRLPSVSVSPSAEIVEGSSVNLTCSSDANPAANYTWYKEDRSLPVGSAGIHHFPSIRSEDRGIYYCTAEDQRSESVLIDVQYAPKLPSVSVSPSAEIVEGSSVTLTCSSDANPAADYTWYKEDQDSPAASGQIFIITDFRSNHSGNYYCEARNKIGFHKSALYLSVFAEKLSVSHIIRLSLVVVMLIPLLLLCLWMRKKEILLSTTEVNEAAETVELEADYINAPDVRRVTTERTEDPEEQEDLV